MIWICGGLAILGIIALLLLVIDHLRNRFFWF